MTETTSTAPTGEQFPLPSPQDEAAELQRLQALVADHRAQGHEIVVVLGVGFVGAVMAGIIADSVRKGTGKGDSKLPHYTCKHLRETRGNMSRAELIKRVRASLKFNGFSQIPQLEATAAEKKKKMLE